MMKVKKKGKGVKEEVKAIRKKIREYDEKWSNRGQKESEKRVNE